MNKRQKKKRMKKQAVEKLAEELLKAYGIALGESRAEVILNRYCNTVETEEVRL